MLITSYPSDKVADIIRLENPSRVCLVFWHGLGDVVMFMPLLDRMKELFPEVVFEIALQEGCGQEELLPEAVLITNPNQEVEHCEYTFQIHFYMAEHLKGVLTKAELCCKEELGIDLISKYPTLTPTKAVARSSLVICHFQATAMPKSCNPTEEVAEQIWNEVKEAGYIPMEGLFQHKWFNQVNKKFDFIDCHVRGMAPSVNKLIGLLEISAASVCVASGNLPLSISIMPSRTLYLEKDYEIEAYTRESIDAVSIDDYHEGSVRDWLARL